MARVSSEENLARLLALPAWVSRHDGATIEEAAAHFHVSVDQLSADVERLWMTGLPGQAPGDLVDFSATDYENGRLRLNEGLGLERPVRLSRDEAISLLLAARVLRRVVYTDPEADAVVASAASRLARVMGAPEEDGSADTPGEGPASPDAAADGDRPSSVLATVRRAMEEGRRLHLTYVSATDARSEREVDPLGLVSDGSHLTLRAWCLSAGAERSFRLDRVLAARVLDRPAQPHRVSSGRRRRRRRDPLTADRPEFTGEEAVLVLAPSGRWIAEQVPSQSVTELDDGAVRVVLRGRDRGWLVGLVLSAGRHLRAVEPGELAQAAREAARRALEADAQVNGMSGGTDRTRGRDLIP